MTNHIRGGGPDVLSAAVWRESNWSAAFTSGDPARQWAAACSVARVVTAGDPWTDSTALHEAACGAFDAVTARSGLDAVPAALFGARRALHWERQARFRLVPPARAGGHRWRAQTQTPAAGAPVLVPLDAVDRTLSADRVAAGSSRHCDSAAVVGEALLRAGWRWSVSAGVAVDAAIDAVLRVGRDRAATALADVCPELAGPAADGLVMLVAGSRRRATRGWPGVVWLRAHYGTVDALADPGTRAVMAAIVAGRRARPASAVGATVHGAPPTPFRRGTRSGGPWAAPADEPGRAMATAS